MPNQPKSSGTTSHDPAYSRSSKNVGKGAPARPASYTNRSTKAGGVSNQPAYRRGK